MCPWDDVGAAGSKISRFDTGAVGYDGEFVTRSGLSEEIHQVIVNQPNFLLTTSLSRRYSFMDKTFPAAGLITSSGLVAMSGSIVATVASEDASLGVLMASGDALVLYKNTITSPTILAAGSCTIPSA